jgi:hypothetical protein
MVQPPRLIGPDAACRALLASAVFAAVDAGTVAVAAVTAALSVGRTAAAGEGSACRGMPCSAALSMQLGGRARVLAVAVAVAVAAPAASCLRVVMRPRAVTLSRPAEKQQQQHGVCHKQFLTA